MSTCEIVPAPSKNPRKSRWRFTWESHSHIPILRLYLFDSETKPSSQCFDLKVEIFVEKSLLTVSWVDKDQVGAAASLRVPVPRVLIDVDSPINFRALDDHIEVKLVLLLPVDHPIVGNLDSVVGDGTVAEDDSQPLHMESDVKKLYSGEEVHFYCRNCSAMLTRALSFFKEMPSVNWREAADNWFGTCCCSFGGVSEKLVAKYANAFACAPGVCLLSATSVVVYKDDIVGCKFPDNTETMMHNSAEVFGGDNNFALSNGSIDAMEVTLQRQNERLHDCHEQLTCNDPKEGILTAKKDGEVSDGVVDCYGSMFQRLQLNEDVELASGCCTDTKLNTKDHDIGCCNLHANEEQNPKTIEVLANKASFLNGLLGNGFMVRSPYLSKDIKWCEFSCPRCSCLLGAYPHDSVDAPLNGLNNVAPLNGGVHLFKCFLSTYLPAGCSKDLLRKYTLDRMFTSQLLESAKDELSFRTVVRGLQTRSPMLQIVLLNPNSWCFSGDCIGTLEPTPKINMYPTVKALFSDCSNSTESHLRKLEQWVTKNQVDDVYMLTSQIKALTESLELANSVFPPSHAYLQGLSLSFLRR